MPKKTLSIVLHKTFTVTCGLVPSCAAVVNSSRKDCKSCNINKYPQVGFTGGGNWTRRWESGWCGWQWLLGRAGPVQNWKQDFPSLPANALGLLLLPRRVAAPPAARCNPPGLPPLLLQLHRHSLQHKPEQTEGIPREKKNHT